MLLLNKKIIISAGASGIGWATAKVLDQRGAQVFLCDINEKRIQKINKNKKNKIRAFLCNADNEKDVDNLFKQIKKITKTIDCLINNVGIAGPTGAIEKLNIEDWNQTLKTNVVSHFLFTKNAIPMLKKNKGGSIINISSTAGVFGFPWRSPYAVSKAATMSFTKTAAMELGKYKIRVNAICPGSVEGDRMKRVISAKAKLLKVSPNKLQKEFESMTSIKSFVSKEDIASIAIYLLSNNSINISGQAIAVDGHTERMN